MSRRDSVDAAPNADLVSIPQLPLLARQHRRAKNRTQFQFAEETGVPYHRYVMWEQGRRRLRRDEILRILAKLPVLARLLTSHRKPLVPATVHRLTSETAR